MELLSWLEATPFAVWVRESGSLWAYPTILTLHTLGLGVLVGANATLDFRLLGFGRAIPLAPLIGLFPVMWTGFALNAITGTALFVADASTKVTQTVFLIKLVFIALGVAAVAMLQRTLARDSTGAGSPRPRLLAAGSLVVWIGAITAGRLMAYL